MELTTPITEETSFESSNKDMGESHIEAHKTQHTFLQKGEPLVEELTNTSINDKGLDLAIKKAQELGIRDEKQWEKYNKGIKHKSRRKKNYDEYLKSLGKSLISGKEQVLTDPSVPRRRREKTQRELSFIKNRNKGIPIYSTLAYIGSAEDYLRLSPDDLKEVRAAEADAFRALHKDPRYQTLHPGEFRAELHYDENGWLHDQRQEVFPYIAKNGRQMFSQIKAQEQNLINFYGGEEKGQSMLTSNIECLSAVHRLAERKKGNTRIDAVFNSHRGSQSRNGEIFSFDKFVNSKGVSDMLTNPEKDTKLTANERRSRIPELVRIEDMLLLEEHAKEAFKQHGIDWKRETKYTTDGKHKTKQEYGDDFQTKAKLKSHEGQIREKQQELDNITKETKAAADSLTSLNKSIKKAKDDKKALDNDLADTQKSVDNLQEQQAAATKQLQQVQQNIKKLKDDENQRKQRIKRLDNQIEEREQQRNGLDTEISDKRRQIASQSMLLIDQQGQISQNEDKLSEQQDAFKELATQWADFKKGLKEVSAVVWGSIKESTRLSLFQVYHGFVEKAKEQAKADVKAGTVRKADEFKAPELSKQTVHEALVAADKSNLSPQGQKTAKAIEAQTKSGTSDNVERVNAIIYNPENIKRANSLDHLEKEIHQNSSNKPAESAAVAPEQGGNATSKKGSDGSNGAGTDAGPSF